MKSEKKETHPPIPPNCPYFKEDADGWCWRFRYDDVLLDETKYKWTHMQEHSRSFRPIIASVAATFWRKEAERLEKMAEKATSYKKYLAADRQEKEARQHAASWLTWAGI